MAYGFKSVNNAGTVQIDNTCKNMVLITKGSVTSSSTSPGSVSFTGTNPVIAINCSTAHIVVTKSISGGTFTYTFQPVDPSISGAVVYYWIFDIPPSTSLPGFGLIVKNTSGEIMYRSDYKPMNVIDFQSITTGLTTDESWTYDSSRTYAAVLSSDYIYTRYAGTSGGFNISTVWMLGLKIASGVVYKHWGTRGTTFGISNYGPAPYQILILDVTNY